MWHQHGGDKLDKSRCERCSELTFRVIHGDDVLALKSWLPESLYGG